VAENDLEKKLKELESKIEENDKEINQLQYCLCFVTIIVIIISFFMFR
jgi:peptidoglycan hydrolase CwlO-like protein